MADASELGANYINNGGGQRFDFDNGDPFAMFAPAEHTEGLKRRKERKRRERRGLMMKTTKCTDPSINSNTPDAINTSTASSTATPKASGSILRLDDFGINKSNDSRTSSPRSTQRVTRDESPGTPSTSVSSNDTRQDTPEHSRPPISPLPKQRYEDNLELPGDDDDLWYAKWWAFCFPDLVKLVTEQRL